MHDSMFEDLLATMDSILSQSVVLLRSATTLSDSLIRGRVPTQILRLEVDDTILGSDTEYSRQELDGLLEPYVMITPLEDRCKGTAEVLESSRRSNLRGRILSMLQPRDLNRESKRMG